MRIPLIGWLVLAVWAMAGVPSLADPVTLMGARGLNRVPDARHDAAGVGRLQLATQDPYAHTTLGFQVTDFAQIVIRQSALTSSLLREPDRLLPGLDLKVKIREETGITPAVSLGVISALGHERFSSEYLAASKRWGPIDATIGVGWGRMGESGTFRNPLTWTSKHFEGNRRFLSNKAADPADWFTGDHIGLFGGIAVDTGIHDITLAADWGSDRHRAEQLAHPDFNAPRPWSLAAHWSVNERWQGSIGIAGGDAVLARLAVRDGRTAARSPAFTAPRTIEPVRIPAATHDTILPRYLGLRGPAYLLPIRSPLSTPEEIWLRARPIESDSVKAMKGADASNNGPFLDLILRTDLSLMEEEASTLSRQQIIAETRMGLPHGVVVGAALGLNLGDDLDQLASVRRFTSPGPMNGRSAMPDFAARRATPTRLYAGWLHSIGTNWHMGATAGYLEEMVAGIGGEVLYRPPDQALALGLAVYRAQLRDPLSNFAAGRDDRTVSTGALTLYYALPQHDTLVRLALHRYLAGDHGVEMAVTQNVRSFLTLEGFARLSNQRDPDPFGGEQGDVYGLALRIPLGKPHRFMPETRLDGYVMPQARRYGQVIDSPIPLYEATTPLMPNAVMASWFKDTP